VFCKEVPYKKIESKTKLHFGYIFSFPMNPYVGITLPPPSPATRQVGMTGSVGSPMSLVRSTSTASTASDIRTPEETLREYLNGYKVFLEHEIQFVDNEIRALIERPASDNPAQDGAFLTLRNSLKIRYNTLTNRLRKVNDLLEVM
jgi:hypothetical protein